MIELHGISKSFPGVQALDMVNLRIEREQIHVILGENGAGKSTLMKILYGMYVPDNGSICIDGEQVVIKNTSEAIRLGLGMVHQHFMLVDEFSGYENIVIGFEPRQGARFDRLRMKAVVDDLAAAVGIAIDLSRKVKELSVGEKQKIEILKLLYRKSEILILDEPTAVLTPNEVVEFFNMIRSLKTQGKGIVLITHKLHEALEIADVISILRDGVNVADTINPEHKTRHDLAEYMVGREVSLYERHPAASIGEPFFFIHRITTEEADRCSLRDVSLSIRKGEILGIAGVDGNGQSELVEVLAGLRDASCREVSILDESIPGETEAILKKGIGFVYEDRNLEGLVEDMSVSENLILGYHHERSLKSFGVLSMKKISAAAERLIDQYRIKTPSSETEVETLSGGNQQKIIIARVLSNHPQVLIISQPTRGVDVGAMEYIHKAIRDFRDQGNAVLLISADLDEVKSLSDRMLVMFKGEFVKECDPEEITDRELGLYMTGAHIGREGSGNERIR